jgi:hypothetical protein
MVAQNLGVLVQAYYTVQVARPAAAYVGTAMTGYALGDTITRVLEFRTGLSYFWVNGRGRLVAAPPAGDLESSEGLVLIGGVPWCKPWLAEPTPTPTPSGVVGGGVWVDGSVWDDVAAWVD